MNIKEIIIKQAYAAALSLGLLAAVQPADANVVDSLVGDKDGFGLPGAPAVPADGTLWVTDLGGTFFTDYRDAYDLANAPFTDIWFSQAAISYTHTYSLGGLTPVSAQLSLQIAGIADAANNINRGPWNVFVDGTLVGQIPQNFDANAFQEIKIYSFSVPVALLTGSDSVLLNINVPTLNDGYIINYSELTITTIPEPSTLALAVLGTLALRPLHKIRSRRR